MTSRLRDWTGPAGSTQLWRVLLLLLLLLLLWLWLWLWPVRRGGAQAYTLHVKLEAKAAARWAALGAPTTAAVDHPTHSGILYSFCPIP